MISAPCAVYKQIYNQRHAGVFSKQRTKPKLQQFRQAPFFSQTETQYPRIYIRVVSKNENTSKTNININACLSSC